MYSLGSRPKSIIDFQDLRFHQCCHLVRCSSLHRLPGLTHYQYCRLISWGRLPSGKVGMMCMMNTCWDPRVCIFLCLGRLLVGCWLWHHNNKLSTANKELAVVRGCTIAFILISEIGAYLDNSFFLFHDVGAFTSRQNSHHLNCGMVWLAIGSLRNTPGTSASVKLRDSVSGLIAFSSTSIVTV